ncbi:RluA family pseudouridine synthase [Vaginisenegalia massiliensis]|uniref:RluA family pseudouridine synthase n=1 Tax=Vaginisenegalia massiliensis TaxID=2058294 RepID=UPI000F549409|nr:RluA family pseudouridine synthase [Vaginisenegalia massiliensis]
MEENKQVIQLKGQAGRIDKVLTELLEESRSTIQKWIKADQVRVNQQLAKANLQLLGDEEITINREQDEEDEEEIDLIAQDIKLDIIYEDEDVMVINKPAGMVVHPSKGHREGTLVNALLYYLGDQLSQSSQSWRPGIVHRIDKDTSGLLVVAKHNQAHQMLSQQLTDHTMGRKYYALVHGQVSVPSGTIDVPLRRDANNRLRWSAHPQGKFALTHYRCVELYPVASLLDLELKTGRTHQIRVHLEYMGHPIIGDPIYRKGIQVFHGHLADDTEGQLLHAHSLHFIHPRSQQKMEFSADIPPRFARIKAELSRTGI